MSAGGSGNGTFQLGHFVLTPFNACPAVTQHADARGQLSWPRLPAGVTHHLPCPVPAVRGKSPSDSPDSVTTAQTTVGELETGVLATQLPVARFGYVSRTCRRPTESSSTTAAAEWSRPVSSGCLFRSDTARRLTQLLLDVLSPASSGRNSSALSALLANVRAASLWTKDSTAADLHLTVRILTVVVQKATLLTPLESEMVVQTMSNVISAPPSVLDKADEETNLVERLLHLLEEIASRTALPLPGLAVELSSPHVVIDILCQSQLHPAVPQGGYATTPAQPPATPPSHATDSTVPGQASYYGSFGQDLYFLNPDSEGISVLLPAESHVPGRTEPRASTSDPQQNSMKGIGDQQIASKNTSSLVSGAVHDRHVYDVVTGNTVPTQKTARAFLQGTLGQHTLPDSRPLNTFPPTRNRTSERRASKVGNPVSGPKSQISPLWRNDNNLLYSIGPMKQSMASTRAHSYLQRSAGGSAQPGGGPGNECAGNRLLFIKVSSKLFPSSVKPAPQGAGIVSEHALDARLVAAWTDEQRTYPAQSRRRRRSRAAGEASLDSGVESNSSRLVAHLARVGGGDGVVRCAQWVEFGEKGRGYWTTTTCTIEKSINNTHNCRCHGDGPVALITFPVLEVVEPRNHHVVPIITTVVTLAVLVTLFLVRNRIRERHIIKEALRFRLSKPHLPTTSERVCSERLNAEGRLKISNVGIDAPHEYPQPGHGGCDAQSSFPDLQCSSPDPGFRRDFGTGRRDEKVHHAVYLPNNMRRPPQQPPRPPKPLRMSQPQLPPQPVRISSTVSSSLDAVASESSDSGSHASQPPAPQPRPRPRPATGPGACMTELVFPTPAQSKQHDGPPHLSISARSFSERDPVQAYAEVELIDHNTAADDDSFAYAEVEFALSATAGDARSTSEGELDPDDVDDPFVAELTNKLDAVGIPGTNTDTDDVVLTSRFAAPRPALLPRRHLRRQHRHDSSTDMDDVRYAADPLARSHAN